MSNSSLVNYTNISPNRTSPREHRIDTITIHCMAGNSTVEGCGSWFAKSTTSASSNYGIGSDGRIGLYVPESDRSWCSSNAANDHRAVTIEVANDGDASTGWHVSDKAMNSLIKLCADICKRNGIKELKWKGDKSLIGQIDKQNMTVHCWFKNKDCPGAYLLGKHYYIAAEVNKILNPVNTKYKVGTYVNVSSYYSSPSELISRAKIGNNSGTILKIYQGSRNPYAVGEGTTIRFFCNDGDIRSTGEKLIIPDIIYAVKVGGKWLPEVKNNSDYAGIENKPITDVMIKLSNNAVIKYRVHVLGGKWLPYVSGYNKNDHNNGYAGNGSPIDAIEIKCDKYDIRYKVSGTKNGTKYYSELSDNFNDYAGVFGNPVDKIQCRINA